MTAKRQVGRCIGCRSTDFPTCHGCGADLSGERQLQGLSAPPKSLADYRDDWEAARVAEREARLALANEIRWQRSQGHSLAEIAQELGVSRQRIHQISEEK